MGSKRRVRVWLFDDLPPGVSLGLEGPVAPLPRSIARALRDDIASVEGQLAALRKENEAATGKVRDLRKRLRVQTDYAIALQRLIEGIERGDISHLDPEGAPHMHTVAARILAATQGDDDGE